MPSLLLALALLCFTGCGKPRPQEQIPQSPATPSTTPTPPPSPTPTPAADIVKTPSPSTPASSQAPVSTPSPQAVAEAQRLATQRFPGLGVAGSPLNAAFVKRYNQYKKERPEYFHNASWPITLVEECARDLSPAFPQGAPAAKEAVQSATSNDPAVDRFRTTLATEVETKTPSFDIFFDINSPVNTNLRSSHWPLFRNQGEAALVHYNRLVTALFPDKPGLRHAPDSWYGDSNFQDRAMISPAKVLWAAADDASPLAGDVVAWIRTNPEAIQVAQEAMQTLSNELGNSGSAKIGFPAKLKEARAALQNLITSKSSRVEDQRKLADFLRAAGVPKPK